MSLCSLPIEVFRVILEEMVSNVGFFQAARLRLVCKSFNTEIFGAICSSLLFENDPRGARVPPESGLAQEYLFRLSVKAKENVRDLPNVISGTVKYLLKERGIEENYSGEWESYSRKLCGAAVAHLYPKSPEYLRYPPTSYKGGSIDNTCDIHYTDVVTAIAILGLDDVFETFRRENYASTNLSRFFGKPLVLAASYNHYKLTKSILHREDFEADDPQPTIEQKCQALKAAARAGHADIVQLILEDESIYKATKEACQDALIEAIKGGHAGIAKWLGSYGSIKMGAPIQSRILDAAVSYGHESIARDTLNYRPNLLSVECIDAALSRAAAKGYSSIARLLIAHGADPNGGGERNPPLTDAAAGGFKVMVQTLLESGADINFGKLRPVDAAAFYGHDEMFFFLVEAGADVSHLKDRVFNILPQVASRGHETMIRILLAHGMDVEATGVAAVLNAIREGHSNIVKLLTSYGAQEPQYKLLVANLHKSARQGYERWVLNLIAHGLDVNSPHPDTDCTPLYWVNKEGHSVLGRRLVELGAKSEESEGSPRDVVSRTRPTIL